MKVVNVTIGNPYDQVDPNVKEFRINFFGTEDILCCRKPEEIVRPFMDIQLFRVTHYGTGDEDLAEASSMKLQDLMNFWREQGFLFLLKKGKDINCEVQIQNFIPASGRLRPLFSTLHVSLIISKRSWRDSYLSEIRNLTFDLSSAYQPCYGCCYQKTGPSFVWSLTKNGIHDIFWINIFGQPYVEMFGLDKLRATPHVDVEALDWGGVIVEAEDPTSEQRQAIKNHLGRRFFVGGSGLFRSVKIPKFKFHTHPITV